MRSSRSDTSALLRVLCRLAKPLTSPRSPQAADRPCSVFGAVLDKAMLVRFHGCIRIALLAATIIFPCRYVQFHSFRFFDL